MEHFGCEMSEMSREADAVAHHDKWRRLIEGAWRPVRACQGRCAVRSRGRTDRRTGGQTDGRTRPGDPSAPARGGFLVEGDRKVSRLGGLMQSACRVCGQRYTYTVIRVLGRRVRVLGRRGSKLVEIRGDSCEKCAKTLAFGRILAHLAINSAQLAIN